MKRRITVLGLAFLICGFSQSSSLANDAQQPVPKEISSFANHQLIKQVQALDFRGDDGKPVENAPDFSGIAIGDIKQVNLFSDSFQLNESKASVLAPLNEWTVLLVRENTPIGTALIWIDSGSVGLAGADNDAELATALSGLPRDVSLVFYPQVNEYYSYDGTHVTPVNSSAKQFLGKSLPVEELQVALTARVAEAESRSGFADDLVGGLSSSPYTSYTSKESGNGWRLVSLSAGIAAALVAGVAVVRVQRSRSRVAQ